MIMIVTKSIKRVLNVLKSWVVRMWKKGTGGYFFPHPFKELLTLSSQCFLPGIANIVDQFFLRLSNNISNKVNRYISISNLYLTFKRLHIVH